MQSGNRLLPPCPQKLGPAPCQNNAAPPWPRSFRVKPPACKTAGNSLRTVSAATAILRSRASAADAQLRDLAKDVVDRKRDLSGN
jgi:hypothetical protein